MRLERLELAGFKSFPDRADVAFDDGVTAIVGPNGCGKSNIVDAITWVLGEQSAKSLRGERMEDVIFAGSDARKATSAAEVRLKFSGVVAKPKVAGGNGDGAVPGEGEPDGDETPLIEQIARDVEVGRRLYRSGESEYLIDGHVCRLRDVQDLLMDVGVGVKGYAVIEQGKIGQILSSKPTDRRQLIEEAAGVTKFKTRRRQAELKLEAAQQNLTRVDDLIYELERQRAALKRQAAKARRYKRLREELRRWEKLLFAQRFSRLQDAIRVARESLAGAREREGLASAHLAEIESRLERVRIELAEADARANALRQLAHQRELENERRQQQITFDTQQGHALAQTAQEMLAEVNLLESRRAPGLQELEERRSASTSADAERDRAVETLAAEERVLANVERNVVALEGAVESSRGALYANVQSSTTLQHAIERAEEGRHRIGGELSRLDVETTDLGIEVARLRGERERAQAELRDGQAALEAAIAARQAAESELSTSRIERDWRQRDARGLETSVAATAGRLTSLEELEATRAAYGEAARLILASPEAGLTHRGSVADYLEVEPGHERAVEAALGDLLQYVIVDTHEDAERGLAFVRERNAGRCGFIVATPPPSSDAPSLETPFGARALASAVRIVGPYRAAIEWSVGTVWIVDAFEDAVRLSAASPVTVVTRGGDVFRGGLLIVGGVRDDGHGILINKREIRELGERLTSERATFSTLTTEIGAYDRAITLSEQRLSALDAERHRHEKVILQHELHTARAGEELERLARRQELSTNERRRYEEERRMLDVRAEEARLGIARLAEERLTAEAALAGAQHMLASRREDIASASRRTAEAGAASAALVERASAIAVDVRRLEDAARELDTRVTARSEERARTEQRRVDLQASVAANRRQLDEDLVAFAQVRRDVDASSAQVDALQHEFQTVEQSGRAARGSLDAVRAQASQLEVACATAESDLSHLAAACDEALQMTLEAVAAEVAQTAAAGEQPTPESALASIDEPVDDEEAEPEQEAYLGADLGAGVEAADAALADSGRAEAGPAVRAHTPEDAIAHLKRKIERLGPVNMMAIEQFDELEQRHSFLTTQRKDLLDSIEQTGQAIKRIEKTTRERFHEAFGTINEYFGTTFSTLFGGGKAGLVLLDDQDELESGIDIIAQPPGKRLQSVQLLSGGEKALTAMALMFALFRYRPSPFCLLDEIDAPLDDANIGRFVEMLRGMQDQTQFILITHHRKTMEIADRLYGVTMEEPGVSKLISIRLN